MSEIQQAASCSAKDQVTADPTQRGVWDAIKGAVLAMIPGRQFANKSVENYRVRVLNTVPARFREGRLMELIKTRMAIAKAAGMTDAEALKTINQTTCWPTGAVGRDELKQCVRQYQKNLAATGAQHTSSAGTPTSTFSSAATTAPINPDGYVTSTVTKRKDKTEIETFLHGPDISETSLALSRTVSEKMPSLRDDAEKACREETKKATPTPAQIAYRQTASFLRTVTRDSTFGDRSTLTEDATQLKDAVSKMSEPPVRPIPCSDLATAHPTPKKGQGALPAINIVQGQDVYGLTCPAGGRLIVQVASQYDGVESPDTLRRQPVEEWVTDGTRTQGPRAALRSVVASAQRADAASSKDSTKKIPDTMREFLGRDVQMVALLRKYPDLCRNGYLEPYRIMHGSIHIGGEQYTNGRIHAKTKIKKGDPTYAERLKDLQALSQYIEQHQTELDSLAQWVKPESHQAGEDHPPELQVFCAAPSFQSYNDPDASWSTNKVGATEGGKWWIEPCAEHTEYAKISKILTAVTYRATAKMGAIAAEQAQGQTQHIYLTQVGQGAFKNPPESLAAGFQAAREELRGVPNVRLYATPYSAAEGAAVRTMVGKLPTS